MNFSDENYIIPHSTRGTLSFTNAGPHTNFSSFMITFNAKQYFDRKYVAFGRVVDGDAVLTALEDMHCSFERPVVGVMVKDCGIVGGYE